MCEQQHRYGGQRKTLILGERSSTDKCELKRWVQTSTSEQRETLIHATQVLGSS